MEGGLAFFRVEFGGREKRGRRRVGEDGEVTEQGFRDGIERPQPGGVFYLLS